MRRFAADASYQRLVAVIVCIYGVHVSAQTPGRSAQLQLSDSVAVRVHLGGSDTSVVAFTPEGVFRLAADSSAFAAWAVAAAHLAGPTVTTGANGARKPMLAASLLRSTDGSGNGMQLVRLSGDAWTPYQLTVSNGAWGYSGKIEPDAMAKLFTALQGRRGSEPDTVQWVPDAMRDTSERNIRPAEPAPGNPRPKYPTHAEFVRADGEVVAQFVVGADGLARRESLLILHATHPLFAISVRDALPLMRFIPASRSGTRVPEVVVQTFEFRVP